MRLVESNQTNVLFMFCPDPITIDKSLEWGEGNYQMGPNGAFLKVNEQEGQEMSISHLVQPNADKTAPLGWVKTGINRFKKAAIWVEEIAYKVGEVVPVQTADGLINYEVKELSYLCYNDKNGSADPTDSWVQTQKNLEKNYAF